MSVVRKLFVAVIFIVGCNACFNPPQFSIVPKISTPIVLEYYEFNNVAPHYGDSISLAFSFTDGDGDLGFDSQNPADAEGQYANKYFFDIHGVAIDFGTQAVTSRLFYNEALDPNQNNPTPTINDTLIDYNLKRKRPNPFDTLPDFVTPYSCTRWVVPIITTASKDSVVDTLYVQLNRHNYNIFVNIYVQDQVTKQFNLFDFTEQFTYPNCSVQGFNGRFPILSSDPSRSAPEEGKIQYGMSSTAWQGFFNTAVMEVGIQIEDRATHESNILMSQPFTLISIKKN